MGKNEFNPRAGGCSPFTVIADREPAAGEKNFQDRSWIGPELVLNWSWMDPDRSWMDQDRSEWVRMDTDVWLYLFRIDLDMILMIYDNLIQFGRRWNTKFWVDMGPKMVFEAGNIFEWEFENFFFTNRFGIFFCVHFRWQNFHIVRQKFFPLWVQKRSKKWGFSGGTCVPTFWKSDPPRPLLRNQVDGKLC